MARGAHAVADAARGRDDADRQHQARSCDQAFFDRQLKPDVETSGVAYGGIARGQGLPQYRGRAHMRGAERLMQPPALRERVAVRREMIVAVDEAGKQREAREIDDVGVCWPGDGMTWSCRGNAPVVDEYGSVRYRCGASAVDQSSAEKQLHSDPHFLDLEPLPLHEVR